MVPQLPVWCRFSRSAGSVPVRVSRSRAPGVATIRPSGNRADGAVVMMTLQNARIDSCKAQTGLDCGWLKGTFGRLPYSLLVPAILRAFSVVVVAPVCGTAHREVGEHVMSHAENEAIMRR